MDNETVRSSYPDPAVPAQRGADAELDTLLGRIDARLWGVLRGLRGTPPSGLLSVTLAVPELARLRPRALTVPHLYWARQGAREYRVGVGCAFRMDLYGPERFDRLERGLAALRGGRTELDPDGTGVRSEAFVGFSFHPGRSGPSADSRLADALLQVPAVLWQRRGDHCALTFSTRVVAGLDRVGWHRRWLQELQELQGLWTHALLPEPRGDRPAVLLRHDGDGSGSVWVERVARAVRAIRRGTFDKVVLSRCVQVTASRALEPGGVLDWLGARYPDCAQFAVVLGPAALVGVSPERLIALRDGCVEVDALAGSAPRHSDPVLDHHLGAGLRANAKERREHALVVTEIERVLAPYCGTLEVPRSPRLLQLPTVQHLWTPIRGRVHRLSSVLQLARRLHPTPAVSGTPRPAALDWLLANGEDGRGWYTGALGWIDADGGGELSVILRCGELQGRRATLYAGAGIVAESDPEQELAETEWKLQAFLQSLSLA